jgi:hypothetical protein
MMRSAISALAWMACCFGCVTSALGHGFDIYLSGNKIGAESSNNNALHNGNLDFNYEELSGFRSVFGFNVLTDTFTVELFGPLWFSDGGPAVPAEAGIELIVDSYSAYISGNLQGLLGSATRSGSSAISDFLDIPGDDDDAMKFSLTGSSITPGVYGIGMRVHGLDEANPASPFDPSDPLVITFMTSDFDPDDVAMIDGAQMAIFGAAVPEPNSGLLALGIAGSLLFLGSLRKVREKR